MPCPGQGGACTPRPGALLGDAAFCLWAAAARPVGPQDTLRATGPPLGVQSLLSPAARCKGSQRRLCEDCPQPSERARQLRGGLSGKCRAELGAEATAGPGRGRPRALCGETTARGPRPRTAVTEVGL